MLLLLQMWISWKQNQAAEIIMNKTVKEKNCLQILIEIQKLYKQNAFMEAWYLSKFNTPNRDKQNKNTDQYI